MKCQYCNAEIADGSIFCTACGKKLPEKEPEKQETKQITPMFCTACGSKLKEGALFCTQCGAKVKGIPDAQAETSKPASDKQETQVETKAQEPKAAKKQPETKAQEEKVSEKQAEAKGQEKQASEKQSEAKAQKSEKTEKPAVEKKSSAGKIAGIVILILLLLFLLGVGIWIGVKGMDSGKGKTRVEKEVEEYDDLEKDDEKEDDNEDEKNDEKDAEQKEEDSEETEEKEVDFDLSKQSSITLTGTLRFALSGYYVLQWKDEISIAGFGDVLIEGVKSTRLDEELLPVGLLDSIESGTEIMVTGDAVIQDDNLIVKPDEVRNMKGKDLIAEYEGVYDEVGDYILPDSDTVKLTKKDIEDLTLQELNYAKNEIYARHGRKFDSQELRDYFGSKDWYRGTIDPADFTDDMLSQVERDNVKLLKDAEFALSPNGYQLDQ